MTVEEMRKSVDDILISLRGRELTPELLASLKQLMYKLVSMIEQNECWKLMLNHIESISNEMTSMGDVSLDLIVSDLTPEQATLLAKPLFDNMHARIKPPDLSMSTMYSDSQIWRPESEPLQPAYQDIIDSVNDYWQNDYWKINNAWLPEWIAQEKD